LVEDESKNKDIHSLSEGKGIYTYKKRGETLLSFSGRHYFE
jgi:hypothetical protein